MDPSQVRRYAWLVAGLFFFGSVINYMDRAVMGVIKPQICADLSISNTGFGWAVNAFLLTYMVVYIVGGRLADRLGYHRMFSVAVVFWSLANMLHAAATGLFSLCFYRALLGIGEGSFYPTALRGSAEWFPPQTRSKAIGIFLCGLSVGSLLTPPFVAFITLRFGWRAAFVVTGSLGFLLVPPWLLVHRRIRQVFGCQNPAPGQVESSGRSNAIDDELSVAEVLQRPKFWFILIARALTDGAWWFFLFWTPGYFQEIRGFDLAMVGRWLWLPYLGADLGALAGGWLAAMLIQRGLSSSLGRKIVLVPSALLGAVGSLVYFVENPYLAIGLLSGALFGQFAWATNVHTAISEISPRRHQAVLYGITGAAGTLTGALTQPLIGYLVDHTGYAPAFVCVGAAYFLAIAAILAAGRIEPLRRAQPAAE